MNTLSLNLKLFAANIGGTTLAWITSAQNFFGLLGAIIGCVSGLILIAINWEKFLQSKPALWAAAKWQALFAKGAK
jgi:hypothetical protein